MVELVEPAATAAVIFCAVHVPRNWEAKRPAGTPCGFLNQLFIRVLFEEYF
ncbi:hypothetical protein [Paraburkholderia sp.]|uniref:hypothetical protein n=1 Tax=Paraburkholderia sp. TaxID=1926495 RepID=UPI003C7781BF